MSEPTESLTRVTQIEAFADAPPSKAPMKVFSYRPPVEMKRNRAFVPMVRSDIMFAMVQIIKEGGEQELHSHGAQDGFWFVLRGSARFYGEDDVVLATLQPHEGIYIPRNFLYWFEAVGDEPLELLQVEAIDKTVKNTFNVPNPKPVGVANVYTPEGKLIGDGLRLE
jgi:mannose-6-phosphate isomerase-like protein (cupin superfamily)